MIGNPIGHTKSPLIHSLVAEKTQQDIAYTAIEGPLQPQEAFADAVRGFIASGGKGINVTAPFKFRAFAMADQCSEHAALAGAANALKFEDGRILGENFDGIGLLRDIEVNLALPLAGKRVLVLGAGGAVRGALLPFLTARPSAIVIANRDVAKGEALLSQVGSHNLLRACGYRNLDAMATFDLVVNATSASLTSDLPPVSPSVFSVEGTAYELVYGKGLAQFLRLARNVGVRRVADGVNAGRAGGRSLRLVAGHASGDDGRNRPAHGTPGINTC